VAAGERVVRVPPRLTGQGRRARTGPLAREQAEGKARREALRCLKRHLARRVWRLLLRSERGRSEDPVDAQRDLQGPQIIATALT
jgi:hypothetical protein